MFFERGGRIVNAVICRDGHAEPLTLAALEGLHRAMKHYHAVDLVPRLLATIEALTAGVELGRA
jgi:hypothetical protein